MTRDGVVEGRARSLPAPVFTDLTGRGRVRRIATDLADRQQHPAVAAALRDSTRIARTISYASTSLGTATHR